MRLSRSTSSLDLTTGTSFDDRRHIADAENVMKSTQALEATASVSGGQYQELLALQLNPDDSSVTED